MEPNTRGGPSTGLSLDPLFAKSVDGQLHFHSRNGVFYPSGFALFALADEEKLGKAVDLLTAGGVEREDITLLRPEQMHEITDRSQRDAGVLSRIVSAELKQMAVLEQLADAGNSFALVKSTDDVEKLLHTVGVQSGASKGLLFHTLAVEELPVDKETIPGKSPFGINEVIRSQDSDADVVSTERHRKDH
jgi:hypothetical protein